MRKWFAHDPAKWPEFQQRSRAELRGQALALRTLKQLERENRVISLVYAASDILRNNAVVLARCSAVATFGRPQPPMFRFAKQRVGDEGRRFTFSPFRFLARA